MSDEKYTALLVLLDRSGSMASIRTDMEGALRHSIATHAAQPGFVTVDVVTFDTELEHTHAFASPDEVEIVLEPRGGTALYDAIVTSFTGFGAALAALPAHTRPTNVLVSIVTDGEENSSREFTRRDVKRLIERQRREHDWDISFLGANQDSIVEAAKIGIDAKDAIDYGSASVIDALHVHTAKQLRRRGGDRTGYTAADRDIAMPGRG